MSGHLACRVCGGPSAEEHLAREMMFGSREEFRYFRCASCGCLQIDEIPPDLARFYPEGYGAFSGGGRGPVERALAFLRSRRARAVLGRGAPADRLIMRALPADLGPERSLARLSPPRDARILDVGCGEGVFLRSLAGAGFTRLGGVDAFVPEDAARRSGGLVMRGTVDDVGGAWDVVMLHHSFEHMSDPLAVMRRVATILAPDGTCIVRVPLVDSEAWERYGVDWVQLDAPRHLVLHTRESIRRVAEAAGLAVVGVVNDSTAFQFWGSEQYRLGIPLDSPVSVAQSRRRSAFRRADLARFVRDAERVNAAGRGDQAAFYLRHAEARR